MEYEFDDDFDDEEQTDFSEDASYVCDSCGEEIVVPLDFSAGQRQEYVEDCPVCCHPNVIFVDFDGNGHANIGSRPE